MLKKDLKSDEGVEMSMSMSMSFSRSSTHPLAFRGSSLMDRALSANPNFILFKSISMLVFPSILALEI